MAGEQNALFDELTVAQNVDVFCALYVRDCAWRRRLVEEAIAFVELERFTGFRPAINAFGEASFISELITPR